MNPVYTRQQLESYKRPQLWDICRTNGLKCYPASADCVEAIQNLQQSVELVAVADVIAGEHDNAQTEAQYVEAQAQVVATEIQTVEISFYDHEVYALGKQIASITYDMDDFQTQRWVAMVGETEVHRADAWAKCHSYILWHYKQGTLPFGFASLLMPGNPFTASGEPVAIETILVETVSPDVIEIDSDIDPDFGVLYRVWNSRTLLGTFYSSADAKWIAQPCCSSDRPRCDTAEEAQLLIVALAGLLVADSGDEVVDLLDKPFDELTVAEWQWVKLAAQQAELVAA